MRRNVVVVGVLATVASLLVYLAPIGPGYTTLFDATLSCISWDTFSGEAEWSGPFLKKIMPFDPAECAAIAAASYVIDAAFIGGIATAIIGVVLTPPRPKYHPGEDEMDEQT